MKVKGDKKRSEGTNIFRFIISSGFIIRVKKKEKERQKGERETERRKKREEE